jgi:tetratricopeptide (TPR) repeat protein
MRQPIEALEAYQRAVEICPLYSDCYFNMGNIYFEGDLEGYPNYSKAEELHLKALECLEKAHAE